MGDIKKEYICPMHPQVHETLPGFCPFCGMALELKNIALENTEDKELNEMQRRFWLSFILTLPIFLFAMTPFLWPSNSVWVQAVLATIVVFYGGSSFFIKAWFSILKLSLNMFSLVSLGVLTAYIYSVIHLVLQEKDVYFESASVITTLVLLGQVLELRTRQKTGSAIKALLSLSPEKATRVKGDKDETVALEDIVIGDVLRVKPGEKVPLDGKIVFGSTSIDESMITGEWIPVLKEAQSEVIGATLNQKGSFLMEVTKIGKETMLARIVEMVNEARRSVAPIQRVVDKISAYFVPIVLLIACFTLIFWGYFALNPSFSVAIMRAVAVVIIACPCALGLATPMAIMVGIGKGAKEGILIRDAKSLETFAKADILLFDKTGTLTEGKPSLIKLECFQGIKEEEALQMAASIEHLSEHAFSFAIVERAKLLGMPLKQVDGFLSVTGKGVLGSIEGKEILVGSLRFLQEKGVLVPVDEVSKKSSSVYLAINQKIMAIFTFADRLKKDVEDVVELLHQEKMHLVMLSGDRKEVAESVGKQLNMDEIYAEVLPEDKKKHVEHFQKSGHIVAMAGDGINDAPALAKADISIAMGTGTHVAMESANIVLVKGSLYGILKARKLSRSIRRNISQNLFLAFFYNILAIPVAAGVLYPAFGFSLSPMIASAAMVLSSLSVVGNALRLSRK